MQSMRTPAKSVRFTTNTLTMSQPFRDSSNKPVTPSGKVLRGLGDMSLKTPGSASRGRPLFNSSTTNNPKTPNQNLNQSVRKALGKKREITPSRNPNFGGVGTGGGDRFMPNRSESQFELAHYLLNSQPAESSFNTSNSAPSSPAKPSDRQQMMNLMRVKSASDLSSMGEDRILVYKKSKAPAPPVGHLNQAKVLYSACVQPASSVKKTTRHIPTAPEKILDAPEFQNSFYMNLVDWSCNNTVAIALGAQLYLWNAETAEASIAIDGELAVGRSNLITSVKWSLDGRYVAVGFQDGLVRLLDPSKEDRIEVRRLQPSRVMRAGVMAWNDGVLSVGHRNGQIFHHDVRVREHVVGTFEKHTMEVCGLSWDNEKKLLASGGADRNVYLWESRMMRQTGTESLFTLQEHLGGVRAVAFCPFKKNTLVTGGGLCDNHIKTWCSATGELQKSVDGGSQITGILFNKDYKEMITSHVEPNNDLKIWKFPTMTEVASLTGHTDRVCCLAMSPDGQNVMSASADESLRVWNCFKIDKSTQRMAQRSKLHSMNIR